MREKLENIRKEVEVLLQQPDVNLEELRIRYLGKKGELTSVLRGMGALTAEERPIVGQLANDVRSFIENALAIKAEEQKKEQMKMKFMKEKLDVTAPGNAVKVGKRHPLAKVEMEMWDIFLGRSEEHTSELQSR